MPTMVERYLNVGGTYLNSETNEIIRKLEGIYGPALHFISNPGNGNDGYINFQVAGMPDDSLFFDLERRKAEIFGLNMFKFQVLRPLNTPSDRGVFVRHLNTPAERDEFAAGFWHY
jgi:hypothetical protein